MQFYPHRTVEEQANRLPKDLRVAYKNSQLDRISIFDGNTEVELTGYAEYSFIEEKSYKTQPVRANNGSIQDIEEYATFLTPRLIIKYSMMNIDDYRETMKMFKRQNGFIVRCYDVVEDKIVRNEMYVAPPSMPIIYQQYLIALGIQEHNIELIGTNVPTNPTELENGTRPISFTVIGEFGGTVNLGMTWGEFVKHQTIENPLGVYISEGLASYSNNVRIGKYNDDGNLIRAKEDDFIFALDYIGY